MIPHCNICIRRQALTTIVRLSPSRRVQRNQVYNFLLCQHGERLLFDPTIIVTHLNRTDFSAFLRHQQLLGYGSAIARRTVAIPGQAFIHYPWLAYTLPLVRLVRTSGRLLRQDRRHFFAISAFSHSFCQIYDVDKGVFGGLQPTAPGLGGDPRVGSSYSPIVIVRESKGCTLWWMEVSRLLSPH